MNRGHVYFNENEIGCSYFTNLSNLGYQIFSEEDFEEQKKINPDLSENGQTYAEYSENIYEESKQSIINQLCDEKMLFKRTSNKIGYTFPVVAMNDKFVLLSGDDGYSRLYFNIELAEGVITSKQNTKAYDVKYKKLKKEFSILETELKKAMFMVTDKILKPTTAWTNVSISETENNLL